MENFSIRDGVNSRKAADKTLGKRLLELNFNVSICTLELPHSSDRMVMDFGESKVNCVGEKYEPCTLLMGTRVNLVRNFSAKLKFATLPFTFPTI